MKTFFLGLLLSFVVGAGGAYWRLDCPGPSSLKGALLVVALTAGYLLAKRICG